MSQGASPKTRGSAAKISVINRAGQWSSAGTVRAEVLDVADGEIPRISLCMCVSLHRSVSWEGAMLIIFDITSTRTKRMGCIPRHWLTWLW